MNRTTGIIAILLKLIFSRTAIGSEAPISDATQECLDCHAVRGRDDQDDKKKKNAKEKADDVSFGIQYVYPLCFDKIPY